MKRKEQNINNVYKQLEATKEVRGFIYRYPLKLLFTFTCILFSITLTSLFFLKIQESSLILPIISLGILIIYLFTLGKIAFGKETITLCMYCRRIKVGSNLNTKGQVEERWLPIEEFIGRPDHDICSKCSEFMNKMYHVHKETPSKPPSCSITS